MALSKLSTWGHATSLALVLGSVLPQSVTAEPKVVSMPIYRKEQRSVVKRGHATVPLENDILDGMFWVNATVGTPGQLVQLQIDTGSSDVWAIGPNSCEHSSIPCLGGVYDRSKSKTSKLLDKGGFQIQYVDNSGATGDYVSDTFKIGDLTIDQLTLAVATDVKDTGTGIMGIGFDTDESIVSNGTKPYPNIIDLMVTQELINSRTYSLWLNDVDAQVGTVLFGGYDTGKFKGELVGLPIQPDAVSGQIDSMTVAWTSLAITDPDQGTETLTGKNFALPAVLDSGTTDTVIPANLFKQIASFVNGVSEDGMVLVECKSLQSYKGTLDFGFGGSSGPVISVPFSEFITPFTDENGDPAQDENGQEVCVLGLEVADDNTEILLGDSFLRSAYVVYDLDRKEIAIAPTVFNSDVTNIVEIKPAGSSSSNSDPWKTATGVTVDQTATERPGPGDFDSASATVTYSATATGFHLNASDVTHTGSSSPTHTGAAALTLNPGRAILATVALGLVGSIMVFV